MSDLSPEAIIAEHGYRFVTNAGVTNLECDCGKFHTAGRQSYDEMKSAHAAHIVSRLRDAGHTIVPMTSPTVGDLAHAFDKSTEALYAAWEAMSKARATIHDHLIGDDVASNALGQQLLRDLTAAAASPTAQEPT
ncbi:hypothetical protein [Rhodococcoides kyotonense]|uniref:Uncharacterized protein n=1 Tax=Rhodococcoides kyotonense TaxID=398843 RepID=A0A239FLC9_9NOCA|nr:hypothetical protein [Rhodococcus kyotonensis]SNS57670.1 hypothetical protein SAMN05421642_103355 [Rhodococcus kyotonensis]